MIFITILFRILDTKEVLIITTKNSFQQSQDLLLVAQIRLYGRLCCYKL